MSTTTSQMIESRQRPGSSNAAIGLLPENVFDSQGSSASNVSGGIRLGESSIDPNLFFARQNNTANASTPLTFQAHRWQESARSVYAQVFICLAVLSEACAFNIVVFAFIPLVNTSDLDWSRQLKNEVLISLYVVNYTTAFIAGIISDTYIPRFWCIFIGYVVYIASFVFLILSHLSTEDEDLEFTSVLITALCGVGIGSGTVLINLVIFGADQTGTSDSAAPRFFHIYYWCQQLGAATTFFLIEYLESEINTYDGPNESDQKWPLITGCGCVVLSFMFFLMGREKYLYSDSQTDLAKTVAQVITTSLSTETRQRYKNLTTNSTESAGTLSLFDLVMRDNGGKFRRDVVDGVKRYLRLALVFSSFLPYFLLNTQFFTSFRIQSVYMKFPDWALEEINSATNATDTGTNYSPLPRDLHAEETFRVRVPITWFNSGPQVVTVIILIPIMFFFSSERFSSFAYKVGGALFSESFSAKLERLVTKEIVSKRFFYGMIFSALAAIFAGLVDAVRIGKYRDCIQTQDYPCSLIQRVYGSDHEASYFSCRWQIFQYIFAGVSNILVIITGYQFAYLEAPHDDHYKMHGCFVGLFFLFEAIGTALSMLTYHIILPKNLLCNHAIDPNCAPDSLSFYWYFYVLAVVQMVGIIMNVLAMKDYLKWSEIGVGFLF